MRTLLASSLLAILSLTTAAWSAPGNYQAASSVLGQPNFTTDIDQDIDARSFSQPEDILIDPATGKVYVSDYSGDRILRFSSTNAYKNRAAAEVVFGSSSFESGAGGISRSLLNGPGGIAMDSEGSLYVAEYSNKRVLVWKNASSISTNGANADVVIGQPDFDTSAGPGTGMAHTRFNGAWGVAIDAGDNLYVLDYSDGRVLRFDNAPSIVAAAVMGTGAVLDAGASAVFGQPDAASFGIGTDPGMGSSLTQGILRYPWGIAIDSNGTLWVADSSNNRVLRWDNAATRSTGDLPDGVLGQPDFTSSTPDTTPDKIGDPYHVAVDSEGTVWISDSYNSRVVGYKNGGTLPVGVNNADYVLGQPNLSSYSAPNPTARSLYSPYGMAATDDGGLFVCDGQMNGGRVLYFADKAKIAAQKASLLSKLNKLKKALKKAKKAKKKRKVKKLKKQIKAVQAQLAAL